MTGEANVRLTPPTPLKELRQTRDVPVDRHPPDGILGDVERRAEHVGVTTEDVRRPEDSASSALLPVRLHPQRGRSRQARRLPGSAPGARG